MLVYKPADNRSGSLGIFCVIRNSGKLTIVLDTRGVKCNFGDPPKTSLPTSGSYGRIDIAPGKVAQLAPVDVSNAFYDIGIPDDWSDEFSRPGIAVEHVGNDDLCGFPIGRRVVLPPCFRVLSIGGNGALHLSEPAGGFATENALANLNGLCISCQNASIVFDTSGAIGHVSYVDSVCVIGLGKHSSNDALLAVRHGLEDVGLVAHDDRPAARSVVLVGLVFANVDFSIASAKLWRLGYALADVLRRGYGLGAMLEVILGRCTCEITVRSLSPLFHCQLDLPWSPDTLISDASPSAFAGCWRRSPTAAASSLGRDAEKWRVSAEDTPRARHSALGPAAADGRPHHQ